MWAAGSRPGHGGARQKKKDCVTYQARQADLTGGAANFFLVTPPPAALAVGTAAAAAAAADGAATGAECSAMTGFAGSFKSSRRRMLSGTGVVGWTEIIRSAYGRGVKGKQTPAGRTRLVWAGQGSWVAGRGPEVRYHSKGMV